MADFNYYYFKNYFNKSKIEEINYFIEKNFDFFEGENDGAKKEDGSLKISTLLFNVLIIFNSSLDHVI